MELSWEQRGHIRLGMLPFEWNGWLLFFFSVFFSHWCGGLMFVIQKTCQEVNIRCRAVQRDLPKVTSFKYQRQWIKFIKLEMWLSPTLLFASFLLSLFSHLPHNQQQLFVTYFFSFLFLHETQSPWEFDQVQHNYKVAQESEVVLMSLDACLRFLLSVHWFCFYELHSNESINVLIVYMD